MSVRVILRNEKLYREHISRYKFIPNVINSLDMTRLTTKDEQLF